MSLILFRFFASTTVQAHGIPSEEAFGTPAVAVVVAAHGIPSEEAFGLATATVVPPPRPTPRGNGGGGRGPACDPSVETVSEELQFLRLGYTQIELRRKEAETHEGPPLSREELVAEVETARRLLRLTESDNEHESATAARMLVRLLRTKGVLDGVLRHLNRPDDKVAISQLAHNPFIDPTPDPMPATNAPIAPIVRPKTTSNPTPTALVATIASLALVALGLPVAGAGVLVVGLLSEINGAPSTNRTAKRAPLRARRKSRTR